MKKLSNTLVLILGGAESGKSRIGERFAARLGKSILYIATGLPTDREMTSKISKHKRRRPKTWKTLEMTDKGLVKLSPKSLLKLDGVLIDGLGSWIAHRLVTQSTAAGRRKVFSEITETIEKARRKCPVIIVSDEVGMGIVPLSKITRQFRELLGRINQTVAKHADEVYFVAAGQKLRLKP